MNFFDTQYEQYIYTIYSRYNVKVRRLNFGSLQNSQIASYNSHCHREKLALCFASSRSSRASSRVMYSSRALLLIVFVIYPVLISSVRGYVAEKGGKFIAIRSENRKKSFRTLLNPFLSNSQSISNDNKNSHHQSSVANIRSPVVWSKWLSIASFALILSTVTYSLAPHIHIPHLQLPKDNYTTSFIHSMLLILLSEIGDKTFFLTAMLCARFHTHSVWVCIACVCALTTITISSVCFAQACRMLSSKMRDVACMQDYMQFLSKHRGRVCDGIVICTFAYYGVCAMIDSMRLQRQSSKQSAVVDGNEHRDTHTHAHTHTLLQAYALPLPSPPLPHRSPSTLTHPIPLAHVLLTCYTMVCVAELGDRSFFSLFTLALQNHPGHSLCTLLGGVAGQIICTIMAYVCGDVIRRYLTEAMVSAMGGGAFLVFAMWNAGQLVRREWRR
ncbi:TMEM165/GDT1 family protein [archaeon]|nr:MAG: TMEM165/GDT1 family protein [archaeon]